MTGKGFVVFSVLLLASDVASKLVDPLPQNKAAQRGTTNVAFSCNSTIGVSFITWSFVYATNLIASGSNVASGYEDTYSVSQSGNTVSTLTVKTANEALAGTYFCNEGAAATASAQLIVYNSGPECTSNVTGQNLTQGQSVQMTCSFSYSATSSSVGVNMVWSEGSSSTPVQNTTVFPTDGRAVSTIIQTVGYSSPFPVYRCQTTFKVNGTTATNDPGYTNTAQPYSSPINVLYFNPNCSITGANSGDSIYSGTSITCKAYANPSPIYRWSNGTDTTLSNTDTVQIANDGQYTCTASNSVGRCTQSINLTTRTTTAAPTTTITTTITPPSTSPQAGTTKTAESKSGTPAPSTEGELSETNKIIIGVVVGVGGFLLILAIIIIICCCKKKNKSGAKYENGNQDITQMTSGAYKKMGTEGNLHQKQASTNVSSAPQSNNSAPKKVDDFTAVDESKVANAKANEDVLIYADLARETHPSVQSAQSDKNPEQSDKKPDQLDKKPDGKITDNGTYADIREA